MSHGPSWQIAYIRERLTLLVFLDLGLLARTTLAGLWGSVDKEQKQEIVI